MSGGETKKRILESAKTLFNQEGLANVRLQMIADMTGISIGNLAYHFKNKEAIVEALTLLIQNEFLEILSHYRYRKDFLDFDEQLDDLYDFVIEYPFFLQDVHDINSKYPSIDLLKQNCASKLLYQIYNRFLYNIRMGMIMPERIKGYYQAEAYSILNDILFLIPHSRILGRNVPSLLNFKRHIWTLLCQHMTAEGIDQFKYLINSRVKIF